MKQVIYSASDVAPLPERIPSSPASGFRVVVWALILLAAFAALLATSFGASRTLAQGLAVGVLLALGMPLAAVVLRRPETMARPICVFFLGCIYFFVLDMAFLRKVEEFQPETVLIAETVIVVFLVAAIGTWYLVPLQRTPLTAVLRRVDGSLTGNTYFWVALIAFGLEYLRRLFFVGWGLPELMHDLLLPRGQGAFRRGSVAGDWRVFLQPIEVLFLGVAVFADRAWDHGISILRKLILLGVVALQLGTLVLDGVRGNLLIAVMLPLFVRAAQHNRVMGRWLRVFVLASFLLAPVMDMMLGGRGYGWSEVSRVERISWNIVEAHRDDNFFRMVDLVNFLRQDHSILEYKGPLGFIEGMREVGWLWLIAPIPRVFWPNKPLATEMGDETREWYVTDSIVGDLLRSGGVTFVVLGGILFGLWLRLLEPLYPLPKGDGAAIAYAFLLVSTLGGIRSAAPWNSVPLLLDFSLVVIGWGVVRVIRQLPARLALRV